MLFLLTNNYIYDLGEKTEVMKRLGRPCSPYLYLLSVPFLSHKSSKYRNTEGKRRDSFDGFICIHIHMYTYTYIYVVSSGRGQYIACTTES